MIILDTLSYILYNYKYINNEAKMEHLKKTPSKTQYVVSVLIGKERFEFIKKNNLSVAKILKEAIDKLMKISAGCLLLSLISCGGGASGSANVATPTVDTQSNITGNLYAKSVSILKNYSLGYDLSYSCSGNACSFTGEFHHYRLGNNDLTRVQISAANLTKSGEDYVGIIYMTSGQQLNASIRIGQNYIKVDNGVNCTKTQSTTTQSGYDSFVSSLTINDGNLQFNGLTVGQCDL